MAKKAYRPGTFCWAELNTIEPVAAKDFYWGVLDWMAQDQPGGPPGMPYTIFSLGGDDVAGMVPLLPELRAMGVPSHWRSYVAVENADASADLVTSLGGTVLAGPFDAHDKGRMALVKDPLGAPFALWEAKAHRGADRFNEPGCLCWNELLTTDVEEAQRFYGGLFGWTAKTSKTPHGWLYYEWCNGGRSAGGMLQIAPDWGPIPTHWNVYFAVANLAGAVEKAKALGAEVMTLMKIDVGEFAVMDDPQGAGVHLFEMAPGKAEGQPPEVG